MGEVPFFERHDSHPEIQYVFEVQGLFNFVCIAETTGAEISNYAKKEARQ